ncbi:unnamed protein product [Calicophoron daubneyi]|uniref:Sin3 histone deacetylase corepressor complex component SDS3 n=1 Tax=Calicophoron daubneyi TaxID=300641 RepID=A0AAV2TC01_CALDB
MKRKSTEKTSVHPVSRENLSDVSDAEETYAEKVSEIQRQLKQLDEKTHPDYLKVKRKVDAWFSEEKQRIQIVHEHKVENIRREFKKESEACDRDCELEKRRVQEYLVSLCEELKRRLEHDRKSIELTPTGDILDFKPAVTRKLRRRGGGGDLSGASASNFMYWGDLLLCGSGWPLSSSSRLTQTDTRDVRSPRPGNSVADISTSHDTHDSAAEHDHDDQVKNPDPVTTSENTATTNSGTTSNSSKGNLFGSLGLNLFDGSLLSHLLASMNSTSSTGAFSNPYMLTSGNGSLGSVFLNGSSSSTAAAAMASGLLMPSALTSNPNSLLAALGSVALTLGGVSQPPSKKRRQQNAPPTTQLNLLLPENDIYADLTIIHRACAKAASASGGTSGGGGGGGRKQHSHHSSSNSAVGSLGSPSHSSGGGHGNEGSGSGSSKSQRDANSATGATPPLSSPGSACFGSPSPFVGESGVTARAAASPSAQTGLSVWIDDGRLYCGNKCFQYGASVVLEGRDGSSQRCTGTIVAIGAQDITIRRSSDHGVCRVTVQQLKQGRYVLWPSK